MVKFKHKETNAILFINKSSVQYKVFSNSEDWVEEGKKKVKKKPVKEEKLSDDEILKRRLIKNV